MDNLKELERRVPIASDKALIDLVNGIQINRDLIHYQKTRGFFGNLFESLTGKNIKRQILLGGNLIEGQQSLCDWVVEIIDSLRISQVALTVTQNSLLEARSAIRRQTDALSLQQQDIFILSDKLDALTNQIDVRLNSIEERLNLLELNVEAQKSFERIVTAWEAQLTYVDLPWIIQVFMLVREVFSSAVAVYELQTNDRFAYRNQLINRILYAGRVNNDSFFSISDLLDQSWQQAKSVEDLQLSLGVLETRTFPYTRIQKLPLLFTIATTLEFALLAEEARPLKPARCALEICRTQVNKLDYTTTIHELITQITHETADDNLNLISIL